MPVIYEGLIDYKRFIFNRNALFIKEFSKRNENRMHEMGAATPVYTQGR